MRDPTVFATNLILMWIAMMWMMSKSSSVKRWELVSHEEVLRFKPRFAVLVFLPVILLVAFGTPRYDTYAYLATFRGISLSPTGIAYYFDSAKEKGFAVLNVLIRMLFGRSNTAFRLVICLMHSIPIIKIYRRYSEDYMFSIYLFVVTTTHMAWMMNGIRQFIAVTMIFMATPLIIERKYLKAVLVVLLAMTFHRSAMVMIAAIFIAQGKPWNKWTLLFSFLMIVATTVFAGSEDSFDVIAETAGYSLDAVRDAGDNGMNPIRALVSSVPMILAWVSRRKIQEENIPIINLCANMSIVTTGISMIAVVTSGIMVGRMPIYTSLWNLILLPHVIRITFSGSTRKLVYAAAVVLYFGFYLFSVGAF